MRALPTRLALYIAACLAGGALIAFAAVRSSGVALGATIGFALLSFVAAQKPLILSNGSYYDVSFVITIATILSAGPGVATIATLFATVTVRRVREKALHQHIFNAAQLVASAGAAGLVYSLLSGPSGPELLHHFSRSGPALAIATAVNFGLNTGLVSGAIAMSSAQPFVRVWRRAHGGLGKNYVAFAVMGFLLGVLHVRMGWGPVLFLLMPLLVARHAFEAAINMQGAYDATARGLMKAIETKDPYTKGHAERVSEIAEMTARAYGLSEERCRAIRYAALMHDVGKLSVESRILQKPGKLTPEEYEHMKIHPMRGVEIIQEIDLLAEAIVGVRHHHERMDGKGYPDGLAGYQIPLFARLITVSDAFDSMTSTRVYRKAKSKEEAFEELHRFSGVMFDPAAIAALEKAIARNGWTPDPEEHHGEHEGEGHDVPRATAI